jgi:hypothetical protein
MNLFTLAAKMIVKCVKCDGTHYHPQLTVDPNSLICVRISGASKPTSVPPARHLKTRCPETLGMVLSPQRLITYFYPLFYNIIPQENI